MTSLIPRCRGIAHRNHLIPYRNTIISKRCLVPPTLPRSMSTAAVEAEETSVQIPTRHSLKQYPRICRDPVELQQETQDLLETPIGHLYSPSQPRDREASYEDAHATIQRAEYLVLGHSRNIPGSLYAPKDADDAGNSLALMQQLLERMQQEGDMYMEVRSERIRIATEGDSPEDSSSSSSSSDSDSDNDTSATLIRKTLPLDFAPPGATIRMYDAVLDGMACTNASAQDFETYYTPALRANDLDRSHVPTASLWTSQTTCATHVTYNAPLRGLAAAAGQEKISPEKRDQILSQTLYLYNHLTHSQHLPRNDKSVLYTLQVFASTLGPSRILGNTTVTFWDQARRLGVLSKDLVQGFLKAHEKDCGEEFEPFLQALQDEPIEFMQRRFVKKYRHSKYY